MKSSAARVAVRFPLANLHFRSLESTNAYARQHAASFDPAAITVVSADEQTAGRGRLGREWRSTVGKDVIMTFAFPIPPHAVPSAYLLSPLLAVVATRVLRRLATPKIGIKWPNDLIYGGIKKVGGILCEVEAVSGGSGGGTNTGSSHLPTFWAALGLGINVNSLPGDFGLARPVWPLTTLLVETGAQLDVPHLRAQLAEELAEALPTYWAHGFNPFHSEYEAANVLKGKRVRFNRGGSSSEGEAADEVVGTVTGVGEDGRLYIWVENPLGTPADVPRGDAGAYVGAPGAEAGGLVDGGATGASAGPGTLLSFLSGEVRGLEVVA